MGTAARGRSAYAHEAVLAMEAGADVRAPAAAVTLALCGSWDHEPPCPLAPHHSSVEARGEGVRLRTVFAVEPALEHELRRLIDAALAEGQLDGPSGPTTWRVRWSGPSAVLESETALACSLIEGD